MRRALVSEKDEMSLSRQCRLLSIGRTSHYYHPLVSEAKLDLMRQIDEIFTEDPTRGTRRICAVLKKSGVNIGRGKVRRLMDKMGLSAIYCKPNLSLSAPNHKKYPYLLRGVKITRVNQVWSTDITYIRLRNGFVYLTAVIDWYSRYVLAWRLSTTLETTFCTEALEEALDNVFVEWLWRSVKYEDVFLKDYSGVLECQRGLAEFFERYNNRREHQSLDYRFPAEVYFGNTIITTVAA